jgi:hypothetical protein
MLNPTDAKEPDAKKKAAGNSPFLMPAIPNSGHQRHE